MLLNFPAYTAWIPDCHLFRRLVLCHDTSGTDRCIIDDRDPRHHDDAGASQQFLPICTGKFYWYAFLRSSGKIGYPAVAIVTFGPNIV